LQDNLFDIRQWKIHKKITQSLKNGSSVWDGQDWLSLPLKAWFGSSYSTLEQTLFRAVSNKKAEKISLLSFYSKVNRIVILSLKSSKNELFCIFHNSRSMKNR
jgi:hypothetical protein